MIQISSECLLCGEGELFIAAQARPEHGQNEAILCCPTLGCKFLGTHSQMLRAVEIAKSREEGSRICETQREGVPIDADLKEIWDAQNRRPQGAPSSGNGGVKRQEKPGDKFLGILELPPILPDDDLVDAEMIALNKRLELRIAETEKAALQAEAAAAGVSVSTLVRRRLFCPRCGWLHAGACQISEISAPSLGGHES